MPVQVLKAAVRRLRASRLLAPAKRAASALAWDRRGVAAVEFALIAPLLLAMYFVTLEVSSGIDANRKMSRTASMVADLVAQNDSMTKDNLKAIMQIGESIIQPYNRSKPTIIATAIQITPQPNSQVTVSWSGKLEGKTTGNVYSKPYTVGAITTVPSELNIPGSFLIRVETTLSYKPMITWAADKKETLGLTSSFDGIEMSETYYLRPRMSQTIACSDC